MASKNKDSVTALNSAKLPRSLRQAVVKIMAERNLDWEPACETAALLIDTNDRVFKAQVDKKANERYNSKFLIQLNKTRSVIKKDADLISGANHKRGYDEGYSKAKDEFEIGYRCSVCSQAITILPWSDEHKALINYMIEHGWHHTTCSTGEE
jgi:hypothetical protein